MTKDEALYFLKSHQPMPGDENLSSELIGVYEEVRVFFKNNPDNRCIPLFLNSFGGKVGYGVYQMVDEVMASVIALAQLALNNIYYDKVCNDLQKKYEILVDIDLRNFVWEVLEDIRNS